MSARTRNTSRYLSSLTYLEMQYLILVSCRIVRASLEYHLAIAVSAVLFRVRPSSEVKRSLAEGLVLRGRQQRSQSLRVASMKKLLNIVYGIGVAVSLALIGFGVWCHFTMDAIIRTPFVFLPVSTGPTISLYYR